MPSLDFWGGLAPPTPQFDSFPISNETVPPPLSQYPAVTPSVPEHVACVALEVFGRVDEGPEVNGEQPQPRQPHQRPRHRTYDVSVTRLHRRGRGRVGQAGICARTNQSRELG